MTRVVSSIQVRMATPEDAHIEAYDNTKLVAINTCPTWGVLRYQMHKTFSNSGRSMPLEAGSAMHELFAAVRLWQLWKYDYNVETPYFFREEDPAPHLIMVHGKRLFGQDRFEGMLDMINPNEDERTNCINFCLQALYSSGFYDDPRDTKRTMSNLEEAGIMYIDRWNFHRNPIWIRDINDPESDVGIEIAFDLVITFKFEDHSCPFEKSYRFCGKLDGLHYRDDNLTVGENKTASRLDDAWRQSFEMSSQVTGYVLAGTTFTQQPISNAIVWGLAIPLPKSYDNGGLVDEYLTREPYMLSRWFDWFLHSVEMYERYENDPTSAPKYTHSCNRYFRSCSFIPFCTADDDDQQLALEEMITEEWSPLHDEQKGKAND